MDKTLIDYDKNLEELEIQREKLEKVMQMMGQEWEESGAGIGWLGQIDLPSNMSNTTTISETPLSELTHFNQPPLTTTVKTTSEQNTIMSPLIPPIFNSLLSPGPSAEYIQSLLNVNEAMLAEGLANVQTPNLMEEDDSFTDLPSPVKLNSPLITPKDEIKKQNDKFDHTLSRIYDEGNLNS